MIRKILFLLFSGLTLNFSACSPASQTGGGDAVNVPTSPSTEVVANGETASPAAKLEMGKVDRNFEPNQAETPFFGEKRFAATWEDAEGLQILIISGRTVPNGEESRMEIFGKQFTKLADAWLEQWAINDFVDGYGCDLAIHLPETAIRIQDVDADEEAEVSFIYELDNRCDASTVSAKLLLHHKGEKYAIRGYGMQFLGPPEHIMNEMLAEQGDDPVKYKALDPAFEQASEVIREFASKEWDEFIASENEGN